MSESLETFAKAKLSELTALVRRRTLTVTNRGPGMQAGDLISFTDNDYLGLATDARVIEAANKAARAYGAGSGASRLVTGNHSLYGQFEEALADYKGTDAALVFGSGFLANSGVIPALVGAGDLIIADSLIHASLHAGIKLSGAEAAFVPHSDVDAVKHLLASKRAGTARVLIVVDGIYSMDGDMAPLTELACLAARYDAWLLVDDAHGLGVVGGGRGSVHACGLTGQVPLIVGTLSKSLGSYGGYLAASRSVVELMKSRARTLVFTTGLPPAVIAAALAALEIIKSEPERVARPLKRAQAFARRIGVAATQSAIVPLIVGDEETALEADRALKQEGFRVAAIRPPTVAVGTSRLRFAFSATHRDADIARLADCVRKLDLPILNPAVSNSEREGADA